MPLEPPNSPLFEPYKFVRLAVGFQAGGLIPFFLGGGPFSLGEARGFLAEGQYLFLIAPI